MTTYHELSIDKLFRLDGEVALVTGGGDGFGRIASMTYANAGASVAVTDIDKTKADAVVAEIIHGGGHAVALELDVSDRTAKPIPLLALSTRREKSPPYWGTIIPAVIGIWTPTRWPPDQTCAKRPKKRVSSAAHGTGCSKPRCWRRFPFGISS